MKERSREKPLKSKWSSWGENLRKLRFVSKKFKNILLGNKKVENNLWNINRAFGVNTFEGALIEIQSKSLVLGPKQVSGNFWNPNKSFR
jgi:hypothetical protein